MSAEHYCDECGKKMKRTAKCEFYCKSCDSTIFDWNVQQYFDGKLSLDDLRGTLNGYGVPDSAMDNAIKNCELIDTMKSIIWQHERL